MGNKSLTRSAIFLLACLCVLMPAPVRAAVEPVFSPTGPDAIAYGSEAGYPVGPRLATPIPQTYLIGTLSQFDRKYDHRVIARPATTSALRRGAEEPRIEYRYQGTMRDIPDYLERHPATGLLIAVGDTILMERYRYARTDRHRFVSQSMAKTITAMLIGVAVDEGAIRSIDQTAAEYVPGLAGTAYGGTSIRDLLHMASGVAYVETYDGNDDSARMGRAMFDRNGPGTVRAVAQFNNREVPAGTRFHYAGSETVTLGLVLAAATKTTLARYAETRLWQPLGAEADATWMIDPSGHEPAQCCFSAVLRDWARLGLMLAHDGAWNGRQIIPKAWILDATSVQAPWLAPRVATPFYGYGYQVWLLPGPRRQFALLGIYGQAIFVDPAAKLVLVHTAARVKPSRDPMAAEVVALWQGLVARYSR